VEKTYSMSMEDLARTKKQADAANARLKKKDGSQKGEMGKDSFLKLLVTELRHQDPTQPMADKEFIAQMAQFSALEQMTNINSSIKTLNRSARSGEAYSLLGKKVEALDAVTGKPVTGIVSKIYYREDEIRLLVGKNEVILSDVHAVLPPDEKQPGGSQDEKSMDDKNIKTKQGKSENRTENSPNAAKGISDNNDINKEAALKAYSEK